nr:hypothetical protein BN993_03513 [Virgibacillus halodenitrificans]
MKIKSTLMAATALTMLGMFGGAQAQSDAMQEAYESEEQSLEKEPKANNTGNNNPDTGSGHSDASDEAINAVGEETSRPTDIKQDEEMKELDAEGASDAESESQKEK